MGFIDARDIASVAVATLTESGHDGRSYMITGGEALSYSQIASKVSQVTGKTVNYVDVPADAVVKGMTSAGFPSGWPKIYQNMAMPSPGGHTSQITDVVEKVAKKKPITFDQFLQDHAAAFKG